MTASKHSASKICSQLPVWGCALAWVFVCSATASASIELPALPFDAAGFSTQSAVVARQDAATGDKPEEEVERLSRPDFALSGISPHGQSTGTSSSTSASSLASTLAIGQAVAILPEFAPDVRGWVSGEQLLQLPDSPGNSLLRPPQVVT